MKRTEESEAGVSLFVVGAGRSDELTFAGSTMMEPDAASEVSAPARPNLPRWLTSGPTSLPRDYASDLSDGRGRRLLEAVEKGVRSRLAPCSGGPATDADRDLDVPAFLRRRQF